MTAETLQAFGIGVGVGICAGVAVMLRWHAGRVRDLWKAWTRQ